MGAHSTGCMRASSTRIAADVNSPAGAVGHSAGAGDVGAGGGQALLVVQLLVGRRARQQVGGLLRKCKARRDVGTVVFAAATAAPPHTREGSHHHQAAAAPPPPPLPPPPPPAAAAAAAAPPPASAAAPPAADRKMLQQPKGSLPAPWQLGSSKRSGAVHTAGHTHDVGLGGRSSQQRRQGEGGAEGQGNLATREHWCRQDQA